jgi:hypothetical protein
MLFLGVEAAHFIGARWAKDDSFLSFVAITDAPEGRSAGLYVATVDWSLGHPVLEAPVKVLNVHLYDDYYPDIYFWDWSPAGDELVYMRESGNSTYTLEVLRVLADGTTQVRTLKQHAMYPQWSPDGRRIALFDQMDGAIKTILPDGTGLVKLTNPNSGQFLPITPNQAGPRTASTWSLPRSPGTSSRRASTGTRTAAMPAASQGFRLYCRTLSRSGIAQGRQA